MASRSNNKEAWAENLKRKQMAHKLTREEREANAKLKAALNEGRV
jgi:hypothetical protein